jgi:hypothetical protein
MISGDRNAKVSLAANFKHTGNFTAQFFLVPKPGAAPQPPPPDPPNFFAPIQAEASIVWSIEGNSIKRLISVSNGSSITGVAQGVRIVVSDVTTTPSSPPILLGQSYFVGITVAPGVRGSDSIPPVLVRQSIVFVVLAASNIDIPLPLEAGAKSVLVTVADLAGTAIPDQGARVAQSDSSSSALAMYDPRAFGFCPLVPGTVKINVANLTASTQVYTVIFGIDG